MIAWSHHNFERMRRERQQKVAQYIAALVASFAIGFLLFY